MGRKCKKMSWNSWKRLIYLLVLSPLFQTAESKSYKEDFSVPEGELPGILVGTIGGAGLNPPFSQLVTENGDNDRVTNSFDVNLQNGKIWTKVKLDRENRSGETFVFYLLPTLPSPDDGVQVLIKVTDINDENPTFENRTKFLKIQENAPVNMKISLGSVTDHDLGSNTTQYCEIVSGNIHNAFSIKTKKVGSFELLVNLIINKELDYEETRNYNLVVRAFDGGIPVRTGDLQVQINILDQNDHQPVFNQTRYTALIPENSTISTSVLHVYATDLDSGDNGRIRYSLDKQGDPEQHFVINSVTGEITVNKPLDYETRDKYVLVVKAKDQGLNSQPSSVSLEISIKNINELPANISLLFLQSATIPENVQNGTSVARISISDPDSPNNRDVNVKVSLIGGDGVFGLSTKDNIVYLVVVSRPPDREIKPYYNLSIVATDSGTPPLRATKSFTIFIDDINDNKPKFTKGVYQATILEVANPGSSVFQVTANDPDEGNNAQITYKILEQKSSQFEWFQIDSHTGLITTKTNIDCEVNPQPSLVILALDGGNPPQSSSATVEVTVSDVNDNQPQFETSFYSAVVPENKIVGSCILRISATDPECGKSAPVKYFPTGISDIPQDFTIHEDSGQICIVSKLDYEVTDSYNFLVKAVDLDGFQTTAAVKITVTDTNDNTPVFDPSNYRVNIEEDFTVDKTILNVQAQDKDSGVFGDVLYNIETGNSQGYFKLEQTTGVISLAKNLPSGERIYQLQIQATDGDGVESSNAANVIISVIKPNSDRPKFEFNQYSFSVAEDSENDTPVGRLHASTMSGATGIKYEIISGSRNWFRIDNTGRLYTVGKIDREIRSSVLLNIQAESGNNPVWATAQVNITINDVNDNKPKFSIYGDGIRLPVKEDTVIGTSIYGVHANDIDDGLNGTVRYKLLNNPAQLFEIDALSGEIRLKNSLNYETKKQFQLRIVAHDQGTPQQESSTATVTIDVVDVNDNTPVFTQRIYDFNVRENVELNFKFATVKATDLDSSHHGGQMSFTFASSPYTEIFGMYPTGELYVKRNLDRELLDLYVMTAVVTDIGQVRLSSSATVRIHIDDYNDNRPIFTQSEYHFDVEENQQLGSTVGHVVALDKDIGINSELHFSITTPQDKFVINPHNGEITTKQMLDREEKSEYLLSVKVIDKGSPSLDSSISVKITVLDMNDNTPNFERMPPYVETVLENKPKGTQVIQMVAKDLDAAENGIVSYMLDPLSTSKAGLQNFAIHPKTGWITTKEVLDYEQRSRYLLVVIAKDSGSPSTESRVQVIIKVRDDNDEAPLFHASKVTFDVVENSPIRTTVGKVQAHDRDSGENGRVSYFIMSGNVFSLFAVDMSSGEIYSIREIDYEESSSHVLGIKAIDNNILYPRSNNISVTINIIDVNDNQPSFEKDPIFLQSIKENSPIGQIVYTYTAVDKDSGLNGTVEYVIQSETSSGPEPDHGSYFNIDSRTGHLKIANNINYEKVHQISVILKAQDRCPYPNYVLETTVTTVIFVIDTNDNYPIFESRTSVHVSEDESVRYPLMHIIAVDKDSNEEKSGNNVIVYNIISGNEDSHFQLDTNSGLLTISSPLDREDKARYYLNISAEDHGSPKRTSYKLLNIIVDDINDNAPKFHNSTYRTTVRENSNPDAILLKVSAEDDDTGENGELTYLIAEGIADNLFIINHETGVIKTKTQLDREKKAVYVLTVYVRDGGYPTQYDVTTVIIEVEDINDNSPVFQSSSYSLNIPENRPESSVMAFVAHDPDDGENSDVTYSITGGNDGHFAINSKTGELSCNSLDRESKIVYNLTISAVDGGNVPRKGYAIVYVQVLDENDNDPVFSQLEYSKTIREDIAMGEVVLQVSATDKDYGHNGEVTFSLGNDTEGFFSVNSTSGEIITTGIFDREKKGYYSFQIIARDGGISGPRNSSATIKINLADVNDNSPTFSQVPYSVDIPQNTDANKQVIIVTATDPDLGQNKKLTYNLQSETGSNSLQFFRIDTSTGEILTKQSLNGAAGYHNLKVIVKDYGSPRLSSTGVVEITVGTGNTNQPLRFIQAEYYKSIAEHSAATTPVIRVSATSTQTGSISYTFANGNDDNILNIDQNTGEIKVANADKLDYEVNPILRMVVAAGQSNNFAYATLQVNLTDINDNAPKFAQTKYVSAVWENNEPDTYVTQVFARDADSGFNGRVTYNIINIIGGNKDRAFVIDPPHTGIVKTNIYKLDREIRDSYRLVIQAIDEGEEPKSSSCILSISIIDENDNQPFFPLPNPVYLKENTDIGAHVTTVTASDVDPDHSLIYDFSMDGNPENTFNIDRLSGRITLAKAVDHERRKHYMIDIKAYDGKHTARIPVVINIEDMNDNPPEFSQTTYQVSLPELTPSNYPVLTVNASDADEGRNSDITYFITDNAFYIHDKNGTIFTNKPLNNTSSESIIQLVVTARDNGVNQLSSMVTVHIQVTTINKYAPIFEQNKYTKNMSEASSRGVLVVQVKATDKDNTYRQDSIDYNLISGSTDIFQIRRKTGEIFLNGDLDRESIGQYRLRVMATDRGDPTKSSTADISITVDDVNDNSPYFLQKDYVVQLPENYTSDRVFLSVEAEDGDIGKNAEIQYTITSGNDEGLFIIHGSTGGISIMTGMQLDYESFKSHRLIVRAVDCKSCSQEITKLSAFVTVDINVTDINDSKPKFPVDHYVEGVYENRQPGSIVFQAHANDQDSGIFGQVQYSIIPGLDSDYFTIDSDTGYVRTQLSFDYEAKDSYQIKIKGVDMGGLKSKADVTIKIRDEDEYRPRFVKESYHFNIPGNAEKGDFLGKVGATDQDGGEAGSVYFYFKFPESYDYFAVNASSGVVTVARSFHQDVPESEKRRSNIVKRALTEEDASLVVIATSGLDNSLESTATIAIEIDRSCDGCKYVPRTQSEGLSPVVLALVIVVCVIIVLIVVIIGAVLFIRKRKHKNKKSPSSDARQYDPSFDQIAPPILRSNGQPPPYREVSPYDPNIANITSSDISTHSHNSASSGRGSAEEEEDEEIRMINSNNFLNHSQGYLRRKAMPDSGIQQDDDSMSEPSVQNHQEYLARLGIDSTKIGKSKKKTVAQSVESMHHFSDEGGGEGDIGIDYNKLTDGETDDEVAMIDKHRPEKLHAGSLSSVINSEEEYSGSYNWDYLLDWGPQYQPLAHVFAEIAKLKDDNVTPKKQPIKTVPQRPMNNKLNPQVKMVPPPMITNTPPKAISQPVSNRTSHSSSNSNHSNRASTMDTSLPSLPRSPISYESSFTSPALTPSFTPSLSPLAARTPSISPVVSSQVNSAPSSGHNTPGRIIIRNGQIALTSASDPQEFCI